MANNPSGYNNGGHRPAMFDNVEELQKKIKEYYKTIHEDGRPPSITGLALFLGFESRQSFYAYEQKPTFGYTIKKARLAIESFYEESLTNGRNAAGPIFALKNFGWRDEQSIQVTDDRKQIASLFPGYLQDKGKEDDDDQNEKGAAPGIAEP